MSPGIAQCIILTVLVYNKLHQDTALAAGDLASNKTTIHGTFHIAKVTSSGEFPCISDQPTRTVSGTSDEVQCGGYCTFSMRKGGCSAFSFMKKTGQCNLYRCPPVSHNSSEGCVTYNRESIKLL